MSAEGVPDTSALSRDEVSAPDPIPLVAGASPAVEAWRDGVALAAVAALLLVSGGTFLNIFRRDDLVIPLIFAVIGSCLTYWLFHAALGGRASVVICLVSTMGVGVLAAAVVVVRSVDLGRVLDGARTGWTGILSSGLPVSPRPEYLLVPFLILWGAGCASAAITLRTRSVFWPVVPAVAVVAMAILLGSHATDWGAGARAAWLLAASGVLVARLLGRGGKHGGGLWSLAPAAGMLGIAGLGALVVGQSASIVPKGGPTQLRDSWSTSSRVEPTLSPLGLVTRAALESGEPRGLAPALRVRTDVDVDAARFVVAILDRYDGASWSSSAIFRSAGGVLPGTAPGILADTTRVRQRIEVLDPIGPWLPALPNSVTLDAPVGLDAQVDVATGSLARGWRAGDPQIAESYEVVSAIPNVPLDRLVGGAAPGAVVANSPVVARPEGVSPELIELVSAIARPGPNPFVQLSRLIGFFTNVPTVGGVPAGFGFDASAARGTTLGALERFILEDRKGSTEQFAAAFALMARLMSFPSRVVVGYVPGGISAGTETEVPARDLRAWPEVYLKDAGWVAFPIDVGVSGSVALPDPVEQQSIVETVTSPQPEPGEAEVPPSLEEPAASGRPWWARVGQILGLLLLIALVGMCVLWAARIVQRRRRQRVAEPVRRVELAWEEAVGLARRLGVAGPQFKSVRELTEASSLRFGEESGLHLGSLGGVFELAVHGAAPVTSDDADRAWALESSFREASLGRLSIFRRVFVDFIPRASLLVD